MPGDASEHFDDELRRDLCAGVVELGWECDSQFAGVFDDPVSHTVAEAAEPGGEGVLVEVPFRHWEGGQALPGLRVARLFEAEEVVEGAR